jgi:hypothetical protein
MFRLKWSKFAGLFYLVGSCPKLIGSTNIANLAWVRSFLDFSEELRGGDLMNLN